jgi:tetratricopeptide (TPR) repeat protein
MATKKGCLIRLIQLLVLLVLAGMAWLYRHDLRELADQVRYTREGQVAAQSGDTKTALALYKQAVKQFPDKGHFHLEYARLLQQTGELSEAKSHYIAGFKRWPKAPADLRLSYARLLTKQHRYNDAVKQYQRLLAYDKSPTPTTYRELGTFYREVAGVAQRMGLSPSHGWLLRWAMYYYQCALHGAPKDYEALVGLAASQKEYGDTKAAIKTYYQAVALRPDRPVARFNLGVSLVSAGHAKQGLPLMQQAIDGMRSSDDPNADEIVAGWGAQVQAIRRGLRYQTGETLPLSEPVGDASPSEPGDHTGSPHPSNGSGGDATAPPSTNDKGTFVEKELSIPAEFRTTSPE